MTCCILPSMVALNRFRNHLPSPPCDLNRRLLLNESLPHRFLNTENEHRKRKNAERVSKGLNSVACGKDREENKARYRAEICLSYCSHALYCKSHRPHLLPARSVPLWWAIIVSTRFCSLRFVLSWTSIDWILLVHSSYFSSAEH